MADEINPEITSTAGAASPVERVAEQVLGETEGESPAGPSRRKRGGARPGAGRPRGARSRRRRPERDQEPDAPGPADELPDEPVTEAEIAAVGLMVGTVWRIVAGRANRRPLEPDEQRQLAEASVPVLRKYGGATLERWAAEINLGLVLVGLWVSTELPKPEPLELAPEAELVAEGA